MSAPGPRFAIVHDEPEACPYLPDRLARLPLRLALDPVTPAAFDRCLEQGDRRFGPLLYRPDCPECSECEALRVSVERFHPTRSQRRVARRNDGRVHVEIGAPSCTAERVLLFERHRRERGLDQGRPEAVTQDTYRFHLVESCVESLEFAYRIEGRLAAVSILDVGSVSASSVYHYFDPDFSDLSLGVYSVLRELAWCRKQSLAWYYLGLYVADCPSLSYKSAYRPHERRILGRWVAVE